MSLIAEYVQAFFKGLDTVTINLFGRYSFSLWDMFFTACVFGIVGYILWKFLGDR